MSGLMRKLVFLMVLIMTSVESYNIKEYGACNKIGKGRPACDKGLCCASVCKRTAGILGIN